MSEYFDPGDLECAALDEQQDDRREREWLAALALKEVRDLCSPNAYEILCQEVGIKPED